MATPVASPKTRFGMTPDLTSPLSFRTAIATPWSDGSSTGDYNATEGKEAIKLRQGRHLPYELRQHCLVYLEEKLYSSALLLLNNLIASGTSFPTPADPAFVPPPNHISLITTLMVHPLHTTRAASLEHREVSSESLIFLRNVLNSVGSVNAKLGEAFTFTSPRRNLNRRKLARKRGGSESKSSSDDEDLVNLFLANEGSLWTRGQDFWHVVGWSFNCSVNYLKRWEYWKIWLEYMLDVIDADWEERIRLNDEILRNGDPGPDAKLDMLENSLLIQYMTDAGTSSTALRRVVRAIFADGSVEAVRAYPEVFEKENAERKDQTGLKRKREFRVDIDQDKYGYYDEDADTDGADTSFQSSQIISFSPTAAEESRTTNSPANPSRSMGGSDAVVLRLRLLALLPRGCSRFPQSFATIPELYDVYYEVIHPLPLPTFSIFMSPSSLPYFNSTALSSLSQSFLNRLLPHSTPAAPTDDLTQRNLEQCFLPFAANNSSVEDNAKVSILVETLFRLFTLNCDEDSTPTLAAAVEKGIAAREAKCTSKRRGIVKADGDMLWLKASADRISFLLQFIQSSKSSRRSSAGTLSN